jgi:hypothetical protein
MQKRIVTAFMLFLLGTATLTGQPKLVLNTPSIDFGNVTVGVFDPHIGWSTLLLSNNGMDTLRISNITLSHSVFSVYHTVVTIPPLSSYIDTLRFTPTSVGSIVGQLTIISNDPDSPTILPIMGFGIGGSTVDAKTQGYRNDERGDPRYRKEGVMDGNRVTTLFKNDGEIAHWPFQPSGVWPKGTDHSYLDGVALLVGAKIMAPGGQVINPIISAYREEVSKDPVTGEEWVLQPVPGYVNSSSTSPAINTDSTTWPAFWPAALGLPFTWNHYWYGYFGRGVSNADFETYFVMDDSKMKKFSGPPFNYFPIATDSTRAGLGLRVEVRGFQWSHVLAEDNIFWHYDIVNISDHDYDTTCFGFYTDAGVGGTNNLGNNARYNKHLNLAYAWTTKPGVPGNYEAGYLGYAYLESPGNPWNGIDDNENGIVDERRDDNIDNNHNWVSFSDLNHNNSWDPGEPLNDDLGRDGVGPTDLQWNGPDEGEGDGVPTHGEPNFDETDKDESDQIGLMGISIYILADKGPTGGWPKNDDVMWGKMNNGFRDTMVNNTNISLVFSSGPFPLKQTRRERFSMALLFGNDLDNLIFNKETVQDIYNSNYNFSKPPYKPTLTAVPGSSKVFLYWDDVAEKSIDRFLGFEDPADLSKGYKKNFEGYLLYRSQEPEFNDVKIITDSKGDPKYWKPLVQWDLVDSISGPDPVGINGARFWRGSNTGLQHSYIDTTVKNGVRYFYALVSYSKGDPNRGTKGLQPTECAKIISADYAGTLKFVDINCAVVTPNAPSAGYTDAIVEGDLKNISPGGLGTGSLALTILNPAVIHDGDAYSVTFKSDSVIPYYRSNSCRITRNRSGISDTVIKNFSANNFGSAYYTPPFDGIVLSVLNDTIISVIDSSQGWAPGKSNVRMRAALDNTVTALNVAWPADYEIRFFNSVVDTSAFDIPPQYPSMKLNFTITNLTAGRRVKCIVDDADRNNEFSLGDTIRILEGDINSNFNIVYKISYGRPFGGTVSPPVEGDRFVFKTTKPFYTGDQFTFKLRGTSVDITKAREQLNKITVVPNPYIGVATWEPRTLYQNSRGDRKIEFKKLPSPCTIRIYTISGTLVKTLYKEYSPSNGALAWNLVSDDGMDIAYGLYIFHVDAPGVGQYIGKFAVVK